MKRAIWIFALGLATLLVACGRDRSSGPDPVGTAGPPVPPGNLVVEKIRDGEIWLVWEESREGDLAFYVVYRGEEGRAAAAVDSIFINRFLDRALDYETEYTYFVTAVDQEGNESAPSKSVSGQPFNNLSPLAPTGLRAAAHNIFILDQLEILLDWDENAEADLAEYRVYRSAEPGFALAADNLQAGVKEPRYVDQEIEVGTVYYYRVSAVDRGGKESAPSASAFDVALSLPEPVEPIQGEETSSIPRFSWRPVPHALSYRVVVTTSPTSGEISDMPLTSDTTAVFTGHSQASGEPVALQSGQVYYWKILASTREDGGENSVSQVERFKIR